MNIVMFGEDSYSALGLQTLVENNYKVDALFAIQNNPHNKRLEMISNRLNIPFHQVVNINNEQSECLIKQYHTDIIFTCNFKKIIYPNIIKLANKCAVNIHTSLLPKYKGLSSLQRVLLNGEKETGITTHFIEEDIDCGNIISQMHIPLKQNMYIYDLHLCLQELYPKIILDTFEKLSSDNFCGIPQIVNDLPVYPRLKNAHQILNTDSVETAYNKVRAFSKPDIGARYENYVIWYAEKYPYVEQSKSIEIHLSNGILYTSEDNCTVIE